jgi:hypothetical protein
MLIFHPHITVPSQHIGKNVAIINGLTLESVSCYYLILAYNVGELKSLALQVRRGVCADDAGSRCEC